MTKLLPPPITTDTTLDNARKWLNIVRYRESGTVIQPQDDCEYRVIEIIENKQLLKEVLGPYYRKFLLAYIPIDQNDLRTSIRAELIRMCVAKRIATSGILSGLSNREIAQEIGNAGFDIGLFVSHVSPLLRQRQFQPLIDLELDIRTSRNLSVVLFSEVDITHPSYHQPLADKCSFLYDHVIRYPLYDTPDALQFLNHYLADWDMSIPEKVRLEIIRLCGGHLWLLHHFIRFLRDNPSMGINEAVSDDLLHQKLGSIWSKLEPDQKMMMKKTYFGTLTQQDRQSHEYTFLRTTRFIREANGTITLGVPVLSQIIEAELTSSFWQAENDHILIGERDLTALFTNKERRVLQLLLTSKKSIVDRGRIAHILWEGAWEEKYSDWAIDRLIYRIRKKLKPIQNSDALLKTVKKKGFIFG